MVVYNFPKISGNFGSEFSFGKMVTGCLPFYSDFQIDAQRLTGTTERTKSLETYTIHVKQVEHESGAPNDGFLSDPLKRYFRLSAVSLKLCWFILGCTIIFLSVRSFQGNFLSISRKP